MITSAANAPWRHDHPIVDFAGAGLPIASLIRTAKIATIEAGDAKPVGQIEPGLMRQVRETLQTLIGA